MSDTSNTYFLHADGDSFFVACELVARPDLKGKPVIVGEDRGIAVAMSSEAKKLGVTRGMPVFQIKKQFPSVVILPHHFDLYREISEEMYQILLSHVEEVERYSIDECFAIVKSADIAFAGGERELLVTIKKEIETKLGVTYSFGLGRTKTLAKTASKLEKPNGVTALLTKEDEERALRKTHIEDVWGIGRRTVPRLLERGLKTAYDFIQFSEKEIEHFFSEPLVVLQKELRGESVLSVVLNSDPRDQKTLQSTASFKPFTNDSKIIWAELADNAEEACARARELDVLSNHVSFFIKTVDFVSYGATVKLSEYTADPGVVLNAIEKEFNKNFRKKERIRSTGITLLNLVRVEEVPRDLFGKQNHSIGKLALERAADKMREKYGHGIIRRASALKSKLKNRGNSLPGSV